MRLSEKHIYRYMMQQPTLHVRLRFKCYDAIPKRRYQKPHAQFISKRSELENSVKPMTPKRRSFSSRRCFLPVSVQLNLCLLFYYLRLLSSILANIFQISPHFLLVVFVVVVVFFVNFLTPHFLHSTPHSLFQPNRKMLFIGRYLPVALTTSYY